MSEINIQGLEEQLHGCIEIVTIGSEKDPVQAGEFFSDFSVVNISTYDRYNSLSVFDCMIDFPVTDF